MEEYCVVTFQITSHAFIFEKAVKAEGLSIKLMPTPRQLSSSCGMSAEVSCEDVEFIKNLLKDDIIDDIEFHTLERKKKKGFFK